MTVLWSKYSLSLNSGQGCCKAGLIFKSQTKEESLRLVTVQSKAYDLAQADERDSGEDGESGGSDITSGSEEEDSDDDADSTRCFNLY